MAIYRKDAAEIEAERQSLKAGARPGFMNSRVLIALIAILVLLTTLLVVRALSSRDSNASRGTSALIKAFRSRRVIEPRLSGGFKAARFNPSRDDRTGIDESQLEKARTLLEDAAAGREPEGLLAYGRFLILQPEYGSALGYLRKAVAQLGGAGNHNDLGVYLLEQGKIEDALDEFNKALALGARMPEALFNRALCYQRLLLMDRARTDYTALIDVDRDRDWLAETKQKLEIVSRPVVPGRPTKEIIADFGSAFVAGDTSTTRKIIVEYPEVVRRHAIAELTIQQLQAAVDGDQAKVDLAASELTLIGEELTELLDDSAIMDLAIHLRDLPAPDRPAEIRAVTGFVRATQSPTSPDPKMEMTWKELRQQFRETSNRFFEVLSAFQLADHYYAAKRFADSITVLKEYLPFLGTRRWPSERARYFLELGLETSRLGQDSPALKYLERAALLSANYPQIGLRVLQYMSVPYLQLGDMDAALSRLRESTRMILKNGLRVSLFQSLSYNYFQIAYIYGLRDRHDLALAYSETALAFAETARDYGYAAEFSSFIALELATLRQPEQVEHYLELSTDYVERMSPGGPRDFAESKVKLNAGRVAVLNGNITLALAEYDRAEALTQLGEGNALATIDVLRARAQAYIASSQTAKAEEDLTRAAALIEANRANLETSDARSKYLDASVGVFDQLISLEAASLGQPSRAFETSEQSRARALLDEIKQARAVGPQSSGTSARRVAEPLKLEDLRAQLPEDLVLVEYSVTDERTYIFLLSHDSFKVVTSPTTTGTLDRLAQRYVADLRQKSPLDELNDESRQLYQSLIGPIEKELRPEANLCIIPDKALHYLPFAALVDGSGRYLIESHRLTYAPSASAFIEALKRSKSKPRTGGERILAVGNPAFDASQFKDLQPLSDAEKEADQSARYYAPGSLVLSGSNATEPRVTAAMNDCEVVHLALHCLVEGGSPWLAALVLAGASPNETMVSTAGTIDDSSRGASLKNALPQAPTSDPNDGLLYLKELYSVRLPRTRLVVLSACQSGLGQYYRGEGIVSLVHPFLAVGVPTVVASLWPINSEATRDLMIEFHKERVVNNLRAGDALRNAQLKMARQGGFQHPYYWAPFIAVGSDR